MMFQKSKIIGPRPKIGLPFSVLGYTYVEIYIRPYKLVDMPHFTKINYKIIEFTVASSL